MAKLRMKKMRLILLQRDSRDILDELQKLGITELTEVADERLTRPDTGSRVSGIERSMKTAEDCLHAMDQLSPPSGGIMSMFSGREEISPEHYRERSANTDRFLKIADDVCDHARRIADSANEIRKLELAAEQLALWESLDVPTQKTGTAYTTHYIGTFPAQYGEDQLDSVISEKCPDAAFDVTVISSSPGMTAASIIVFRDDSEAVYSAVRELGFTAPADPTRKPPHEKRKEITAEIGRHRGIISASEDAIRSSVTHRSDVRFLYDYLTAKRDKYAELEKVGIGDAVMVCEGYIPEKYAADAASVADGYTAFAEFFDPGEEDDVPVALENSSFSEPMESVVEMYSMPGKHDIDPSAIMAFFYYFLFGMMLSDAGYGILMTVFSAVVLRRTTVEGSMAKMLKMFFWCGISTTIWGILFGSFFGDIIPVICTEFLGLPAPDLALWFTPIDNAITLLVFSLGIGICHLLLGLITATVVKWRQGYPVDALLDNLPTILLLVGIAPLGGSVFIEVPAILTKIGAVVAIVGVVGIILFTSRSSKNIFARIGGGLYGLYNNVSGYLSDILSYSRLLALGLATGSIAEVFNMMGTMPENPVAKAILLTVVFIAGHSLNMAINLLGAYVHTVRLQFVELLPKFYEGGGRQMKPFAMNTKFFKIRKENSAENK